jgi:hypothetical protein
MSVRVHLEVARKRVVACAQEWPGWCRIGRDEAGALEALKGYAGRYADVAREAGLDFPEHPMFEVVQRLPAKAAYTEMGIPFEITAFDRSPLGAEEADRIARLVEAAWRVFDRIVASTPAELVKGPRGGGRDRDKMADHVLGAESAYARKLGLKHRQPAHDDRAAVEALRSDLLAALRFSDDAVNSWPRRYAARRIAWHVLDHAWEMQDRTPAG